MEVSAVIEAQINNLAMDGRACPCGFSFGRLFVMGDKGWHLRTFGIPTFRTAQTTIRNEKENRLAAFRKRRNEVVVMVASAIVGTASFVGILYRPLDAPIAEKITLSIATGIALIILMVIARRRRLRSL